MFALRRIAVILLGYLAASVVATLVVYFTVFAPSHLSALIWQEAVMIIAVLLRFLVGTIVLPALVVIAVAENRGFRSVWFYALAGAAAGAVCDFVMLVGAEDLSWDWHQVAWFILTSISAGAIAGMVYWAIAGRNAGQWRSEQVQ